MTTSCLGGWCAKRDTCKHYIDTTGQPIERLCEPGQHDAYQRVIVIKAAPTTQPEEVPA